MEAALRCRAQRWVDRVRCVFSAAGVDDGWRASRVSRGLAGPLVGWHAGLVRGREHGLASWATGMLRYCTGLTGQERKKREAGELGSRKLAEAREGFLCFFFLFLIYSKLNSNCLLKLIFHSIKFLLHLNKA